MEKLKQMLQEYVPYDKKELEYKKLMIWYLEHFGEKVLFRDGRSRRHFTTSVFLFNAEHTKVLMCYHLIDRSWTWLGGHADGEADLKSVVLREIHEEAGIKNYHLINDGKIAALTSIPVPWHVKNGQYISPHIHLDVAFVGEADENEELIIKPDENNGVRWINIDELEHEVEDKWKMKNVYQKLIEQYQ